LCIDVQCTILVCRASSIVLASSLASAQKTRSIDATRNSDSFANLYGKEKEGRKEEEGCQEAQIRRLQHLLLLGMRILSNGNTVLSWARRFFLLGHTMQG
jgi:hypothetical protein